MCGGAVRACTQQSWRDEIVSSIDVSPTAELTPSPDRVGIYKTLRYLSLLVAVIAIGITSYMTYNKLSGQSLPCTNEGLINCSVVESSAYASILGVPTAAWGLAAHLIIAAIVLLDTRVAFLRENSVLLLFGITLFGVLYHSYLLYVSFSVLRALCPWCIAAAACMLVQLVISGMRLRKAIQIAG
jgi:uncharacterized membrane protein